MLQNSARLVRQFGIQNPIILKLCLSSMWGAKSAWLPSMCGAKSALLSAMCGAKSANLLRTWMGVTQTLLRILKGAMQTSLRTFSGDIIARTAGLAHFQRELFKTNYILKGWSTWYKTWLQMMILGHLSWVMTVRQPFCAKKHADFTLFVRKN